MSDQFVTLGNLVKFAKARLPESEMDAFMKLVEAYGSSVAMAGQGRSIEAESLNSLLDLVEYAAIDGKDVGQITTMIRETRQGLVR